MSSFVEAKLDQVSPTSCRGVFLAVFSCQGTVRAAKPLAVSLVDKDMPEIFGLTFSTAARKANEYCFTFL